MGTYSFQKITLNLALNPQVKNIFICYQDEIDNLSFNADEYYHRLLEGFKKGNLFGKLMFYDQELLAGYIAKDAKNTLCIVSLLILPKYRNSYISEMFFSHIEEQAKKQGYKKIIYDVCTRSPLINQMESNPELSKTSIEYTKLL